MTYDPNAPRFPDVSHHNPVDNEALFKTTKPACLGFKVNEEGFTDPTWHAHDSLAFDMNIPSLGYEFAHNDSANDYLALFAPKEGRIPCGDFESGDLSLNEAEGWVTEVHKAWGRWPLVYAHSWAMGKNIKDSALSNCPSWQATYGTSLTPVAGFASVVAWQYTDGQTKWHSPGPRVWPGIGASDISTVFDIGFFEGGDLVLTNDDAKQLGYATVGDWEVQEKRAKGVSDAMLDKPKRVGQGVDYEAAFDATKAKFTGGSGSVVAHAHDLPTATGGVAP